MWFAKLFGGREDDSEPSEFPPHPAATAPKPTAPTVQPSQHNEKSLLPKNGKAGKGGFDPYNSGNFDKNKAWERVIR